MELKGHNKADLILTTKILQEFFKKSISIIFFPPRNLKYATRNMTLISNTNMAII